jgi:hypothetical protein
MWGDFNKQNTGSRQGWVREGNIDVFLFKQDPERVKFLTEDVNIDQIMSEKKMTREQAQEYVEIELMFKKWIRPIGHWEHVVPSIPNQRFFSTLPCQGSGCILCGENDKAKASGVTENKLLPYPMRKRFIVPAYFYSLERVLFVKQTEEFFKDIAVYIDRQGSDVMFDIFKEGKGFNTRYKSIYIGPADQVPKIDLMSPEQIDLTVDEQTVRKTIGNTIPDFPPEETNGDAGGFEFPFGSYKGHTIKQVYDMGETEYLTFLRENSSGLVQKKVAEFLDGHK